jgi:hypothetical protein
MGCTDWALLGLYGQRHSGRRVCADHYQWYPSASDMARGRRWMPGTLRGPIRFYVK